MIEAATIKAKRTAAGIAGNILCKKIGTARSRLSDIERGFITPSPEELARIDRALDELIEAKSVIDRVAASMGWPLGAPDDARTTHRQPVSQSELGATDDSRCCAPGRVRNPVLGSPQFGIAERISDRKVGTRPRLLSRELPSQPRWSDRRQQHLSEL